VIKLYSHFSSPLLYPPAPIFFAQAAAVAVEKEWGRPPIFVREGGTVRVTTFLEKTLRAPAIHLPIGQSSDSPHLPNERIRLLNLVTGTRVLQTFFQELSRL
jgi:di- and tripeptidase